jgi:hypothetical protein
MADAAVNFIWDSLNLVWPDEKRFRGQEKSEQLKADNLIEILKAKSP